MILSSSSTSNAEQPVLQHKLTADPARATDPQESLNVESLDQDCRPRGLFPRADSAAGLKFGRLVQPEE